MKKFLRGKKLRILLTLGLFAFVSSEVGAEVCADASADLEALSRGDIGGRWGRVVWVTNLQDSGEGSLRAALTAGGERTVLFRVGGEIELRSPLTITHPYVTVAGESAPGDGIRLVGGPLMVAADEVILRHFQLCPKPCSASLPLRGGLPAVDSDWDGMPDAWERRYGLEPTDPADGLRDPDGDGLTNLEEFLNASSPLEVSLSTDSASSAPSETVAP